MNIPSSFTLGALEWRVSQVETLSDAWGTTDLSKTQVALLNSLKPDLKEHTFCHELVHCILFAMGKRSADHDEAFIDAFATFLHQYFKTQE